MSLNRSRIVVTVIACCTLTAGFGLRSAVASAAGETNADTPQSSAAESERVAHVSEQWARLWSAKNLDAVLALYADDADFLPASGVRVTGRAAIRDLFAKALTDNNPDIHVQSKTTNVSGDLAYDIGEYQETITSGGKTLSGSGSYLVVLKRDGAMGWLIVAQMWTDIPSALQ